MTQTMTQTPTHRPKDIAVDRAAGEVRITWADGHVSAYSLRWLRANCPCASCREERREAVLRTESLSLSALPPPSAEIAGAELAGNYAVRFEWADGHASGIYTFAALRACCPCEQCNPNGPPPLLDD